MKKYSLLRYGGITEPHIIAVEKDGIFTGYTEACQDWKSGAVTVKDLGVDYPSMTFNDIYNSVPTDAEEVYVFGQQAVHTTNIANPFQLPSIEAALEVASYERNIESMQRPRLTGLAQVALIHRYVIDQEQGNG
jgi:hypothetical protein